MSVETANSAIFASAGTLLMLKLLQYIIFGDFYIPSTAIIDCFEVVYRFGKL